VQLLAKSQSLAQSRSKLSVCNARHAHIEAMRNCNFWGKYSP